MCVSCCYLRCKLKFCLFSLFQICGFSFLTEGIALAIDKVFDHRILKQTLFSSFAFDGLSFNSIRESLYLYLSIYGTVLIIFCVLEFFTLGIKSKCFHVCVSTIPRFYFKVNKNQLTNHNSLSLSLCLSVSLSLYLYLSK